MSDDPSTNNPSGESMDTTEENQVDEDDRKLFAGGLPQEAKEAEIREHFSKFGEVDAVNLKTDAQTGRSRGFCFVVYKSVDSVEKACAQEEHEVLGKKIAVKKAQAKQGKIYIGKLKPEITEDDIKEFFGQYGTVVSVEHPFDKVKNEKKNFAFVTFEREETAKKLLKEGNVTLKGHELEINKVTPKPDPRSSGGMFGGGRGGGRGGGGGAAWGGYPGGGWGYAQHHRPPQRGRRF